MVKFMFLVFGLAKGPCSDAVRSRYTCGTLTLRIKRLPNALHGQKTANEKLIRPSRTQLWLRGPKSKE